jgi:hypothetical protein
MQESDQGSQPSNGSTGEPEKGRSQTKVPSLQTEALVSKINAGVRPRFPALKRKHW